MCRKAEVIAMALSIIMSTSDTSGGQCHESRPRVPDVYQLHTALGQLLSLWKVTGAEQHLSAGLSQLLKGIDQGDHIP